MGKKGFYLFPGSKTEFTGVEKKVDAQVRALSEFFDSEKIIIEKKDTNIFRSLLWRLPFGSWGAKYGEAINDIENKCNGDDVEFFYIRAQAVDLRYLRFLCDIKNRHKTAKIIYEIPTFPYDKELLQDKTMWPWFIKDRLYRHKLKKFVDRIVTFSSDEQIYGIETIRTMNGISVNDIPFIASNFTSDYPETIRLVAVAQFQKSHGYERLIRGLATYYSSDRKQSIILHMIGDGEERKKYEQMVRNMGIDKYVVFHGIKKGEELERFYENVDIGVGCFGLYKRNINSISSLKTIEYLAHGLPVITGVREEILEKIDNDYYYEFSNDESDIDIGRIVQFYNCLRGKHSLSELRTRIRTLAKKYADINVVIQPVVDYIINS